MTGGERHWVDVSGAPIRVVMTQTYTVLQYIESVSQTQCIVRMVWTLDKSGRYHCGVVFSVVHHSEHHCIVTLATWSLDLGFGENPLIFNW